MHAQEAPAVKDDSVSRCQEAVGHSFQDPSLLKQALTHASVADHRLGSNERLEFLGDAILGMVICQELFSRFPEFREGELTKMKSVIVSRRTCTKIARRLGLEGLMYLGKGMGSRQELPGSVAACVLEAVIAAIYLDSDFATARSFVVEHFAGEIERVVANKHELNYKSILQQYGQRYYNKTPYYEMLDEKGPDHSKCFEIAVVLDGRRFPSAWGPNKKEAEQKAAYFALRTLSALQPDQIDPKFEAVGPDPPAPEDESEVEEREAAE
jgi:ribonuclease-3